MAHREGGARALTGEQYDPGADAARRFPDWVIRHRDLRGVPEVMCLDRKVILLDDSHDRAGRRCTLAHAVAHIDLKHQATTGVLSKRQELAADRLAARRLIRVEDLAREAAWAESFEELAHELDVDERTLWVRVKHLRPAEQQAVFRLVGSKTHTA